MRSQGIGDVAEINYAIVEQNGSLSILKKKDATLAHTLIIDGEYIDDGLSECGYSKSFLDGHLKKRGTSKGEVFLMTASDDGAINIIMKEGGR